MIKRLESEPRYFFADSNSVSEILNEQGVPTNHPHHDFYKKHILDNLKGTFFVSPEEMKESILNYIPKIASLSLRKKSEQKYPFPLPQVTKEEIKRLYIQEAKGIYDEELEDEIISKFLDTLEKYKQFFEQTFQGMSPPQYMKTYTKDFTNFINILQQAKTPEEKMIAIDQVINTMHGHGKYGEILIQGVEPGYDPFFDELSNLKISSNLNFRKTAEPETMQENFYEPGKSDEWPKGPKKPRQRLPFYNYPDEQGNIINIDPNYSNPMEYESSPGPHPQGPGIFGSLSMRKTSQLDKQLFYDFYGVSLLSDQYLEQNPYASQYKDMIVQQVKEEYAPLITKSIYKALVYACRGVSVCLLDWNKWKKEFNIKNLGELKNLPLEQVSRIWNEGKWNKWMKRKVLPWGHITESLIQLINTSDTNQLITIIDHINDIQHNTGLLLEDFPETKKWIAEVLEIKAGTTLEQLLPYLSSDIQKFVIEDLQLKGQEVVEAPEKYLTGLEKSRLASNPRTPPETLVELAKDEDPGIRWEVAKNKNTLFETLTELVKDKEDFVRDEAKKRLKELKEFASKLNMRKKAQSVEYILEKLNKFKITNLGDIRLFIYNIASNVDVSEHLVNGLILDNMRRFPSSFIEQWKVYVTDEYGLGTFTEKLASEKIGEALGEWYRSFYKEPVENLVKDLKLEEIGVPWVKVPFSALLQKYTEDEIWDIASGKKTDVTVEEVEQAKEVISRGIVANKLSMRKETTKRNGRALWAIYEGQVVVNWNDREDHAGWFQDLGWPMSGVYFDRITRGRLENNNQVFWYKNTGTIEEYNNNLDALVVALELGPNVEFYVDYLNPKRIGHKKVIIEQEELLQPDLFSPSPEFIENLRFKKEKSKEEQEGKYKAFQKPFELIYGKSLKETIRKNIEEQFIIPQQLKLRFEKSAQFESQTTKQQLKRLYKQEAKGIYDEELMDQIIVDFINTIEGLIKFDEKDLKLSKGAEDEQIIHNIINDEKKMLQILQQATTPQEKMIAIDRVINTAHEFGVYGEYLITDIKSNDLFFEELSNLKVSSLNLKRIAQTEFKPGDEVEFDTTRYFGATRKSPGGVLKGKGIIKGKAEEGLYNIEIKEVTNVADDLVNVFKPGFTAPFAEDELKIKKPEKEIKKEIPVEKLEEKIEEPKKELIKVEEPKEVLKEIPTPVEEPKFTIEEEELEEKIPTEEEPEIAFAPTPTILGEPKEKIEEKEEKPFWQQLVNEVWKEYTKPRTLKKPFGSKTLVMRKEAVITPSELKTVYELELRYRELEQKYNEGTLTEAEFNQFQQTERKLDNLTDRIIRDLMFFFEDYFEWYEGIDPENIRKEEGELQVIEEMKQRWEELNNAFDINSKMIVIDNTINMMHVDFPIIWHLKMDYDEYLDRTSEEGLTLEKSKKVDEVWSNLIDFLQEQGKLKLAPKLTQKQKVVEKLSMRKQSQQNLTPEEEIFIKDFVKQFEHLHNAEEIYENLFNEKPFILDLTKHLEEDLKVFSDRSVFIALAILDQLKEDFGMLTSLKFGGKPKKYKGPIISILEDIAQDVWKALDLTEAKNIVLNRVENSQIAEEDKQTIINNVNRINNLLDLQKYIANSILAYEGMGTKLSMKKKATLDSEVINRTLNHFKENLELPKIYENIYNYVLNHYPELSTWEIERFSEIILGILESKEPNALVLGMRKKANADGLWAIYNGEIYKTTKEYKHHETWFEEIGLPTGGTAFDSAPRGIWYGNNWLIWYKDTGTFEEFSDNLPKLLSVLKLKPDTEISVRDPYFEELIPFEKVSLNLRKKAGIESHEYKYKEIHNKIPTYTFIGFQEFGDEKIIMVNCDICQSTLLLSLEEAKTHEYQIEGLPHGWEKEIKLSSLQLRKTAQNDEEDFPTPLTTKQELFRLYRQEAKGIYDEELMDEIISKFIQNLLELANWEEKHPLDSLTSIDWSQVTRGLISVLEKAKTPQEKMVAIDTVIHTSHMYDVYAQHLISGYFEYGPAKKDVWGPISEGSTFLDELSNLKISSSLNLRKKAETFIYDEPISNESSWAIYKGNVYITYSPGKRHPNWFEEIGLPSAGEVFDNIVRGYFYDYAFGSKDFKPEEKRIVWYGMGDYNEFYDHLEELKNALNFPPDAMVQMLDYTQGITTLAMKKEKETSNLITKTFNYLRKLFSVPNPILKSLDYPHSWPRKKKKEKIAQDISDSNKLSIQELKRFYKLERKGLLTDEFVDNVITKLIYGMEQEKIRIWNDPDIPEDLPKMYREGYEDDMNDFIHEMEIVLTKSLPEKIIAIDQIIHQAHLTYSFGWFQGDFDEIYNTIESIGEKEPIESLNLRMKKPASTVSEPTPNEPLQGQQGEHPEGEVYFQGKDKWLERQPDQGFDIKFPGKVKINRDPWLWGDNPTSEQTMTASLSLRKKAFINIGNIRKLYKQQLKTPGVYDHDLLVEIQYDFIENLQKLLEHMKKEYEGIEEDKDVEESIIIVEDDIRELEFAVTDENIMISIDNIISFIHDHFITGEPHIVMNMVNPNLEEEAEKLFETIFSQTEYLFNKKASILDYPQKHLDPEMWDLSGDLPKLKKDVKTLIIKRFIDYLREVGINNPELWCKGFYYTGSTATYRYLKTSDIDIHVEVDWDIYKENNLNKAKDDNEEMQKELLKVFWNTLNKEKLPGTSHPLTYYILSAKESVLTQGEEAYDILNDKWIVSPQKMPENLDVSDKIKLLQDKAENIMKKLDEELGKTKRDLIDYNILKELVSSYEGDKEDIQKLVEKKLEDIEQGLKQLQKENEQIHEERNKAFYDGQEPIEKGLSKNWTPGNILFKLIERYRYLDILRKIKHIIKDDQVTEEETKELEDVLIPKLSMRKTSQKLFSHETSKRNLESILQKGLDPSFVTEPGPFFKNIPGYPHFIMFTLYEPRELYRSDGGKGSPDSIYVIVSSATIQNFAELLNQYAPDTIMWYGEGLAEAQGIDNPTKEQLLDLGNKYMEWQGMTDWYISTEVISPENIKYILNNDEDVIWEPKLAMRKISFLTDNVSEIPENWVSQDKTDNKKLRRTNPPRHDKNDSIVEHNLDPHIDLASLSLRKKAFFENEGGLWAVYEGKVYITPPAKSVDWDSHVQWFETINLPSAGKKFDDIERGYYGKNFIGWLKDSGKLGNFVYYVPELITTLDLDPTITELEAYTPEDEHFPLGKVQEIMGSTTKLSFEGQPTTKNYNSPSLLLREDQGPGYPSEPAQAEIEGTVEDDPWGESNRLKKYKPTKELIFPDFSIPYGAEGGEIKQI